MVRSIIPAKTNRNGSIGFGPTHCYVAISVKVDEVKFLIFPQWQVVKPR